MFDGNNVKSSFFMARWFWWILLSQLN